MYQHVFLRVFTLVFTMYWSSFLFAQDEHGITHSVWGSVSELDESMHADPKLDEILEQLDPQTGAAIAELDDCLKALSSGQQAFIFDRIMRLTEAFQAKKSVQEKICIYNQLRSFNDTRLQKAFKAYWNKLQDVQSLQTRYEVLWFGQKIQRPDMSQKKPSVSAYRAPDHVTVHQQCVTGLVAVGVFGCVGGAFVPAFFGMPWLSVLLLTPCFVPCLYENCCRSNEF